MKRNSETPEDTSLTSFALVVVDVVQDPGVEKAAGNSCSVEDYVK